MTDLNLIFGGPILFIYQCLPNSIEDLLGSSQLSDADEVVTFSPESSRLPSSGGILR